MQTAKQAERQKHRNFGKYARVNPCELCGKSCGVDYYSDERCNRMGIGVTLHGKCAELVEKLDDEQFRAVLTK